MPEPSRAWKALVLVGFPVSLSGVCWLVSLPNKPREIVPHIGFICAGLCATGCTIVCWAAIFAYVARKLNRSPGFCLWAGVAAGVPGLLLLFFSSTHMLFYLGSMLVSQASFTGYVCRRIAFPTLTDEQATARVPRISLFSK